MIAFIDTHRDEYGVESICKQLPIAPSTYYEYMGRQLDSSRLPARVQRDAELSGSIRRIWEKKFRAYGARKFGDSCTAKAFLSHAARWSD